MTVPGPRLPTSAIVSTVLARPPRCGDRGVTRAYVSSRTPRDLVHLESVLRDRGQVAHDDANIPPPMTLRAPLRRSPPRSSEAFVAASTSAGVWVPTIANGCSPDAGECRVVNTHVSRPPAGNRGYVGEEVRHPRRGVEITPPSSAIPTGRLRSASHSPAARRRSSAARRSPSDVGPRSARRPRHACRDSSG